ncbi:phage/plasmid primase, P4 family [Streptomyces sp. NPDC096311]|uniref:phage/plasmid primase, P4 family n=1 Tax=Streptomyces sp. NPDC096311 TaxID=3366083 RepID=UPI0038151BD5
MAYPIEGLPSNNPLLRAALTYARMGWAIFPLRPLSKVPATQNGFKDATTDPAVITTWWTENPNANIGIATGASNLFAVDVDTKGNKVGAETLKSLTEEYGELPSTYTVQTWSGGWQHYFQMPEPRLKNSTGTDKAGLGPDIDTRGDGGYVVAAPSVVEDNDVRGQYRVTVREKPAELPVWIPEKLSKPRKLYVAPGRPTAPPVDRRTGEILEDFQGTPEGLRRRMDAYLQEIRDEPVGGRGEPWVDGIALELSHYVPYQLQEDELRAALYAAVDTWQDHAERGRLGVDHGLRHIGKPEHVTWIWEERRMRRAAPRTSDQFEDSYLAESVVANVLAGTYRYVPGLEWKAWTGQVWRNCDELEVAEQVRQWAVQQYKGALDQERQEPGSVPGDVLTGWRRTLRADKQIVVLKMARGFEGVFTMPEELDRDPDKLNAQNGVVDLITGERLPHDPDLLMTKIAGAEYRPGYRHPDWDKALEAVPEDTREWLQLREGQAATGYRPPDGVLVVSQGSGENGKTTKNETIMNALGDYSTLLSDRVLMADPSAHPTELMDLMGVRYAVMEETPEARRLDTQRLKRTVGTPKIKARRMRQDSVEFTTTHAMFISTNFRPEITETDHGSWRRVALAVYPYRFRKPGEAMVTPYDRPGDPGLQYRCETDPDIHAAALAWLVEGAQRWYAAERVMPPLPERVAADTLNWRRELDVVLAFSADVLIFEPGHHVHGGDFKDELDAYLIGKGMNTWSERTVAARFESHEAMKEHGVEYKKVRANPQRSRSQRQRHAVETNPYLTIPGGATYKAWTGVRFRTVADDADEWVETADQDHVLDVPDSPVTPQEEAFHGRNGAIENIGNIPGQSEPPSPGEPLPHARAHARDPRPGRPFVPPGGNTPPAA